MAGDESQIKAATSKQIDYPKACQWEKESEISNPVLRGSNRLFGQTDQPVRERWHPWPGMAQHEAAPKAVELDSGSYMQTSSGIRVGGGGAGNVSAHRGNTKPYLWRKGAFFCHVLHHAGKNFSLLVKSFTAARHRLLA